VKTLLGLPRASELRTLGQKFDNIPEKEYDGGQGELGKDKSLPSPHEELASRDKKEHYKKVIDTLSRHQLDQLDAVMRGSSLAVVFQMSSEDDELDRVTPESSVPLWKDRTTGRDVSPADWIRMHYGKTLNDGSWDPDGLTRADLQIDPQLYSAYAQQVKRNPKAAISELPVEEHKKSGDAEAILEERRAKDRNRKALKRSA